MRKLSVFMCVLILLLTILMLGSILIEANQDVRDGKKVLSGPNGRMGCDCDQPYENCHCNISN
jgi:hypothetical protein